VIDSLKIWYRSQWWEGRGVKPETTVENHWWWGGRGQDCIYSGSLVPFDDLSMIYR